MNTRIITSLVVYALWIAITLLGTKVLLGGEEVPLDEMVKNGIGWQFVAAIVLLVAFIYARRWNDLALRPSHSVLQVMWFPVAWLLLIFSMTLRTGLPPASMMAIIAFNTLPVGISEETMFSGMLFRALLRCENQSDGTRGSGFCQEFPCNRAGTAQLRLRPGPSALRAREAEANRMTQAA